MLAEVKKKCSRFQCKDNDAAPAACFLYLTATKSVLLILLIEFAIFLLPKSVLYVAVANFYSNHIPVLSTSHNQPSRHG